MELNMNLSSTDGVKPWYQSKTLWVNVLTLAISILAEEYGVTHIPVEYQVPILAIANIVLRLMTVTKVGR